jgi:hypothetical protein
MTSVTSTDARPTATVAGSPRPASTDDASYDPVTVVRTYVHDSDPMIRSNAASAMAAISEDYPHAAATLVDMWFNERDRDVKEHIEHEMLTLRGGALETLDSTLHVYAKDPARHRAALICRARLRVHGVGAGKTESVEALIAALLDPAPPAGAARMFGTLAALSGEERDAAAKVIVDKLRGSDRAMAQSAYALLGRLRAAGSRLARPGYVGEIARRSREPVPFYSVRAIRRVVSRLLRVTAMATAPEMSESRAVGFHTFWLIVGWSTAAALLVGMYLWATLTPEPPPGFYAVLLLAVPTTALVLATTATRRMTPIDLHYDRVMAALAQAGQAAAWVLGPVVFGLVLLVVTFGFVNRVSEWVFSFLAALSVSLFVFVIRIGTVLGYINSNARQRLERARTLIPARVAATLSPMFRKRMMFLHQTLAGASAGFLLSTMLLLAARVVRTPRIDDLGRLVEGMWLFVMPTAAAIAAAFAAVDGWGHELDPSVTTNRRSVKRDPSRPPPPTNFGDTAYVLNPRVMWRRRSAFAVIVAPLLLALVVLVWAVRGRGGEIDIAPPGAAVPLAQWFTQLPASRDFRVAFPQRVQAEVPPRSTDLATERPAVATSQLRLIEWSTAVRTADGAPDCGMRSNRREIQQLAYPGRVDEFLGWGCYAVEVSSPIDFRLSRFASVAAVLDTRIMQASTRRSDARPFAHELRVTLNADSTQVDAGEDAILVADRSRRWLLSELPARQSIILTETTGLLLTTSPGAVPRETGPVSSRPTTNEAQLPGVPTADVPLVVEIWNGGPEPLVRGTSLLRAVLPAGKYDVRVVPDEPVAQLAHVVALNIWAATPPAITAPLKAESPLLTPPATVRGTDNLKGHWPIPDASPADFEFVAERLVHLFAYVPPVQIWTPHGRQSDTIHYSMELLKLENEPRSLVANTTQISATLESGRYRLRVTRPHVSQVLIYTTRPVLEIETTSSGR